MDIGFFSSAKAEMLNNINMNAISRSLIDDAKVQKNCFA
jgi:hypothetical protein